MPIKNEAGSRVRKGETKKARSGSRTKKATSGSRTKKATSGSRTKTAGRGGAVKKSRPTASKKAARPGKRGIASEGTKPKATVGAWDAGDYFVAGLAAIAVGAAVRTMLKPTSTADTIAAAKRAGVFAEDGSLAQQYRNK